MVWEMMSAKNMFKMYILAVVGIRGCVSYLESTKNQVIKCNDIILDNERMTYFYLRDDDVYYKI